MEYRKLISFGKGGYVVSLPKSWVEDYKLRKGSVLMLEKSKGNILLSPSEDDGYIKKEKARELLISVDDKPYESVLQALTSAYLNSYGTIHLVGDSLSTMLPDLKNYIQRLMALEIFESSRTKLMLRDFLDFSSISVIDNVRKMDITIRSMLSDLLLGDKALYDSIISRENDVDRLFLVVVKTVRQTAENSALLKAMHISMPELSYNSRVASSLESIADSLERFVNYIKEHKLSRNGSNACNKIISGIQGFYLNTMKALHRKENPFTSSLAGTHESLCREFRQLQKKHSGEHPIPVLCEVGCSLAKSINSLLHTMGETPSI